MIEIQIRLGGRGLTPACERELIELWQKHVARMGVCSAEMRYRENEDKKWRYIR